MSKPEEENSTLKQAIASISSLIPLSNSIRVFSTKWKSITNKLEELSSYLSAVEICNSGENSPNPIAVESILTTLNTCDALARRCLESSYGGKLFIQSNLDIVSAKLDAHVKSLSDIYGEGILSQSYAIVVSRPGVSASKEDVRFYVDDLLSRMKIGSTEMKKQALIAFGEVIGEDERYLKVCLEIDGFVNVIVKFLGSNEVEIQEEAAKSVCLIAGYDCYKSLLICAGIISPLIRVLESGSSLGKEFAARCLMKLTENSDNVWSVSAHGGVTALLKICEKDSNSGIELISLSCLVLKNLIGVEEIKRFMVEKGVVSELIDLVRSKDESIQISSLDLLLSMSYKDVLINEKIVKEGGIQALMVILDPKSLVSLKTRAIAFKAIVNICYSYEESITILLNNGFMDYLLYFLRYGELSLQELALKASSWLSGTTEDAKKAMGDAGFMSLFTLFLDSKALETRRMAGESICGLLTVPKNRKRFVQDDENVCAMLRMLDLEEVNVGVKKVVLSSLMVLASSSNGRKKIVNSGYLKCIEKLAEAEVSDAKKIVRKVSCSRFSSIFSGLWSS